MHIISKKIVYITFLNSYKIQVINWTNLPQKNVNSCQLLNSEQAYGDRLCHRNVKRQIQTNKKKDKHIKQHKFLHNDDSFQKISSQVQQL